MTTWADVRPGDRILGKDGNVWRAVYVIVDVDDGLIFDIDVELVRDDDPTRTHRGNPDPTAEVEILPQNTEADAVRLVTDTFGGTVHDPCPHCNGTGVIQ